MVEMEILYEGDLHCRARHGPSGTELTTDAPVDNQGKGESFSPTDLLATSLGVCMMTVMGIHARDRGIDLAGSRVRVVKEMAADPHRRVGRLGVTLHLPERLDPAQREALEEAARGCPVCRSIGGSIRLEREFVYDQ
jgi:putative redox protein